MQVLTGMFSSTSGKIDDRWQRFMKFQINRTRGYFADAESGIDYLDADTRWPVWSALILYRSAWRARPGGEHCARRGEGRLGLGARGCSVVRPS